jgi:hypothetical protein
MQAAQLALVQTVHLTVQTLTMVQAVHSTFLAVHAAQAVVVLAKPVTVQTAHLMAQPHITKPHALLQTLVAVTCHGVAQLGTAQV